MVHCFLEPFNKKFHLSTFCSLVMEMIGFHSRLLQGFQDLQNDKSAAGEIVAFFLHQVAFFRCYTLYSDRQAQVLHTLTTEQLQSLHPYLCLPFKQISHYIAVLIKIE